MWIFEAIFGIIPLLGRNSAIDRFPMPSYRDPLHPWLSLVFVVAVMQKLS
ncbi:hypothetical protein H6F95_11355 [Cyanobacteria bacterium FACHB-471]|nr:hypothetical protein [Cyanobacteria bacterium FACHB-471]